MSDIQRHERMRFQFRRVSSWFKRMFIRHAWRTSQQKWTTSFVVAGFAIASLFMPGLGIAIFGTAFAGWWLAVLIVTVIFGMTGNRIGIGREKAEMQRRSSQK